MLKKKNNKNITLINAVSSMMLQIFTIISGFIIPKLILVTFGSEVNGLIASFNQFFGYISLVEGGLTGVVMAKLYKPLVDKNNEKISSIVNTTKKFYNKLAVIFSLYTIILAIVYPLIVKTNFSYMYVSTLGVILGIGLFIQYNFSLALRILLNADKKVYIVSITQIFILFINLIMFILVIKIFPNIHILKLITALLYIIQPIVYNKYIKQHFDIDKNAKSDMELIKDRWDGFAISLAAFIHNNTDVIILTLFTDLKMVSVYSVYSLVTSGLRQIIKAFSAGIVPSLGNIYAKGNSDELKKAFDFYEYIVLLLTFFLFSVGGILITPFVLLYTTNIGDVNYNQPIFGILLIIAEAVFCIREPYLNLTFSANKFKEVKKSAYLEAILNIGISLILVFKLGIIGVAIGTLISMIYRTIYQVCFLKKYILYRKVNVFIKRIGVFMIGTFLGEIICVSLSQIFNLSIISWLIEAILYSVIMGIIYVLISLIYFKKEMLIVKEKVGGNL